MLIHSLITNAELITYRNLRTKVGGIWVTQYKKMVIITKLDIGRF